MPHNWVAWEDRLWNNTAIADGCWEWLGAKVGGYGRIRVDGIRQGAHRVWYEYAVGPIPEGLVIDHRCENPGCVNPAHLFPKKQQENILLGHSPAAKHAKQATCIRGHEFTPENTRIQKQKHGNCRVCRQCEYDRKKERRANGYRD